MNKICTSIEQSKKLIELGIDVNTADMRYGYTAPWEYFDRKFDGRYDEVPYLKDFFSENEYDSELPAWSLTALLELMPGVNFYKSGNKTKIENAYRTIRNVVSLIDAAFEMVCWLKENGKI